MSYYDYIKKYSAEFRNNYTSWNHASWGRKSNFKQLLEFRAFNLNTGRVAFFTGYKLKSAPSFIIGCYCFIALYGIWISQDVYQKFNPRKATYYDDDSDGEIWNEASDGGVSEYEEKMPLAREDYSHKYDFSYQGLHNQVTHTRRRFRYR